MMYLPRFRGLIKGFTIACSIVFLIQQALQGGPWAEPQSYRWFLETFGLNPSLVFQGAVWQLITWVFLHGGLMHLLFNALGLWMFGSMLQDLWGTSRFRSFCLWSGLLTGLCVCLFGLIDADTYRLPTIGASGIVFACIMGVSVVMPHQVVLFFFVFPMKMKYFAYIMVAIEFYALWSAQAPGQTSAISTIAHLSGAVVGYVLARRPPSGRGKSGLQWIKNSLDKWRYQRMRKRLRVVKSDSKRLYN